MARNTFTFGLTRRVALWLALLAGLAAPPSFSQEEKSAPKEAAPQRSKLDEPEDAGEPAEMPADEGDARSKPAAEAPTDESEQADAPSPPAKKSSLLPGAERQPPTDPRLSLSDWVVARERKEPVKVHFIPTYLDLASIDPKKDYRFLYFKEGAQQETAIPWNFKGADIKEIQYYEQRVLNVVAELLHVAPEEAIKLGTTWPISKNRPAAAFTKAAHTLEEALDEHDSAVQRKLRDDVRFKSKLRKPLLAALYNLRLSEIDVLNRRNLSLEAIKRCDERQGQFAELDPDGAQFRTRYETAYMKLARRAFDQGQFAEARERLAELDRALGSHQSDAAADLRRAMADKAREQIKLASAANASGDRDQAAELLDFAQQIWPELDDIDAHRQNWDKAYPILRCAYPYLPQNFSPLFVQTPVERHAASLIFESLVRWTNSADEGLHYRASLAEDPPLPLARGRQFHLRRCEWCDPELKDEARLYFSVEDVIWTEQLQQQDPWASAQISLLENVSHSHGDPFCVDILLKMDHWQPMSFMDFWIMPKYRFQQGKGVADSLRELNERPVGTGPYFLAERREDTVRFRANPRYRERGTPRIKEIQFNQMDPDRSVEQFLLGKVDLIYSVRKAHRDQLAQQGKQDALKRLHTPSVYFLAPNYAPPGTPLADSNFRLAIAHAIDREEILNQYFRDHEDDIAHRQLTGPFPYESWAYNKEVPLYQADKAPSFLKLTRQKLSAIRPLTLRYPDDDPNTEIACTSIKEDLAKTGIEIEIESVPIHQWYDRIVKRHDFDLVYWRHDFLNATYALWPLFDPKAKDPGTNFMSYDPDPDMTNLFGELRQHKKFATIEKRTKELHAYIATNAIVIPLWQLDTYVAVGDRLQQATLDPWTLFGDVQHWSLTPTRP